MESIVVDAGTSWPRRSSRPSTISAPGKYSELEVWSDSEEDQPRPVKKAKTQTDKCVPSSASTSTTTTACADRADSSSSNQLAKLNAQIELDAKLESQAKAVCLTARGAVLKARAVFATAEHEAERQEGLLKATRRRLVASGAAKTKVEQLVADWHTAKANLQAIEAAILGGGNTS